MTTAAVPSAPSAPAAPSAAAVPSTTAVFVRLKLSLLRNGLRQSTGRKAVWITSVVLVSLYAALQVLGLIVLRGHAHVGALSVCMAALLAFGWAVMPLFFPGGDETMDPTRLVMLPLRPTPMMTGLLAASLVGIGPGFTLAVLTGTVIASAHGAAAFAVGVLAAPLALLVCLSLARAVATANVRLLTSRKGRDLALLSGLVIGVGGQFVNLAMQQLNGLGMARLEPVADVLRWIPPGSALDAVRAASEGSYGRAAAGLALTAAALAALLWWWQRSLTKVMTSPDASTIGAAAASTGKERASGPGLARLLPAGRTGAAMHRSLRYIWRDPKTKASWVSGLAVGALVPIVNAAQGAESVWFSVFAPTMLGLQMYNQFGQDGPAFWMVLQTIGSPRDAYVELRARALAFSLIAVPYVTLVVTGTAAFTGKWSDWAEVLGLSLALLGALFATGALASVLAPYSIPQDSGFKNVAPGQGAIAWFGMLGALVGAVLCAPLGALAIWLHVAGAHSLLWILLPLGAGYGLLTAWLGLRLAAPRAVGQLPEILAAVNKG
ncbi:transporter [Streptomyces griseocarneus]|uniref:transporter n=1 Tax=Streptomyces griseocarneus TaxID=51201 RepID=UPI00167E489A|nr:transporter [Streptomyces griseocarneus]MBZ6473833.1 transporter [Streptomyces griseocarneus]GHG65403.1 transporter [Streptomyces griseocarneus]